MKYRMPFLCICCLIIVNIQVCLAADWTSASWNRDDADLKAIRTEIERVAEPLKSKGSCPTIVKLAKQSMDRWRQDKSDFKKAFRAAYYYYYSRKLDDQVRLESDPDDFNQDVKKADGKSYLAKYGMINSYEWARCRFIYETTWKLSSPDLVTVSDRLMSRSENDWRVFVAYVEVHCTVHSKLEQVAKVLVRAKAYQSKVLDSFSVQHAVARSYMQYFYLDRSRTDYAKVALNLLDRLPSLTYSTDFALRWVHAEKTVIGIWMKEAKKKATKPY